MGAAKHAEPGCKTYPSKLEAYSPPRVPWSLVPAEVQIGQYICSWFFFLRKINELIKSFVWQSFSFKTWGGRDINKDSWECRVGTPIFNACCYGHPQCYVLFLPPLAAHSKDPSWWDTPGFWHPEKIHPDHSLPPAVVTLHNPPLEFLLSALSDFKKTPKTNSSLSNLTFVRAEAKFWF